MLWTQAMDILPHGCEVQFTALCGAASHANRNGLTSVV